MKCACYKSLAVLLNTHTWHRLEIYTCLEMSLYPLVSIAMSLGRHLKRRGQLKHSFSRAFGEERVQEVRDMCYFPTGATLRMCQSHVSGNDSEKKDGRRGRSGRQRPDFTEKAWDQWIGSLCTSAHTHTHAHSNKHIMLQFDAKIDLSGARQKNLRKTYRQTHQQTDGNTHKWNTSTSIPLQSTFRVLLNSPPP